MKRFIVAFTIASLTLASAATAEHGHRRPPVNTSLPVVTDATSSTPIVGDVLATTNGTWGYTPASFAYQWQRCDAFGNACQAIPGATASRYTITTDDMSVTVRAQVTATNGSGSTTATSLSFSLASRTPPDGSQPYGIIPHPGGGSWTSAFTDEFNGTMLDTTRWWATEGWGSNDMTTHAANVTVSGGLLHLGLPSASSGSAIVTGNLWAGAPTPSSGYLLPVGGYVEARVQFPGSSPTQMANWSAFWTDTNPGTSWPTGGEIDVAETNGGLTANYHGGTRVGQTSIDYSSGVIAGPWANSFHVYGAYRAADHVDIYWDGALVKSYGPLTETGQPQQLVIEAGNGSKRGWTTAYGPDAVLVDWVRAWK